MMESQTGSIPASPAASESDSSDNLRHAVAVIRTRLPLLIASAAVAAGAAFVFSEQQPRVYEAQTTLVVGQSLSAVNPDYTQLLASQRLSTTYASVATSRPLLDSVIDQLGLGEASTELSKRVKAQAALDSTLLTITAQAADPTQAAALADAVAQELIAQSPAVRGSQANVDGFVDAALEATQAQITATQEQTTSLMAQSSLTPEEERTLQSLQTQLIGLHSTFAGLLPFSSNNASNEISVLQPAVIPDVPTSPRPLLNAMLSAVVALFIAASLTFIAQHLDDTVKDPHDLQAVGAVPALGRIPGLNVGSGRLPASRLVPLLYPRSQAAEAYRTVRTNLEFSSAEAPIRTLLVVSAVPAEGRTVTAANLALVFAQAGRRVLLVDADLRKPGLHTLFDLPNTRGLSTMIRNNEAGIDGIAHETDQQNLRVLTTGPLPPDPGDLLGSLKMRAVVDRLRTAHDMVIFDSPTLLAVADATILSSFLDATLMVVHAGRTRRGAVRSAREALAMSGARMVGAVMNRVSQSELADAYYSDYYRPDVSRHEGAGRRAQDSRKSAGRSEL